MIQKVKEIAESWIIAANPSDKQLALANARLEICNQCDFIKYRERTGNPICGECGCPLKKKIFSPNYDACPKHNWLPIENSQTFKETQKESKTFL